MDNKKTWKKRGSKRKKAETARVTRGFAASAYPPPTLAIAAPSQGTTTKILPGKKTTNATASLMKFFPAVSAPQEDAPAIGAADGGHANQVLARERTHYPTEFWTRLLCQGGETTARGPSPGQPSRGPRGPRWSTDAVSPDG